MKFKWFLVLSCLAGAPMLAQAGEATPALTGAVYPGHAPDTASIIRVARARIFLGYDIYGHRIYAWHHVRRVLLGYTRFGRPIYGYIINNRPVFRTLYEYRMIVRPAHVDWDWGGRHWDRRWDRGEHRGWDRGEHRGWDRGEHRGGDRGEHRGWDRGEQRAQAEGEHHGWRDGEHRDGDRHDRDQMRPRDEGARTGGQASGTWEHSRQAGSAAMGETHHRPDTASSANVQGSAQAPAGSQTTQQSGQQQERHHEWRRRHDESNHTTAAPPAGTAGTTSTVTPAPTTH